MKDKAACCAILRRISVGGQMEEDGGHLWRRTGGICGGRRHHVPFKEQMNTFMNTITVLTSSYGRFRHEVSGGVLLNTLPGPWRRGIGPRLRKEETDQDRRSRGRRRQNVLAPLETQRAKAEREERRGTRKETSAESGSGLKSGQEKYPKL
ncbi:hypothetical protein EYF80_035703 [Liparis tanakae]|uniref:Uncharacterized protein n=1 Tax=Liparis tanakae TaxID=230148 RepID=A0A4Z2GN49_9TELE|nr:hypothetical protein EYF80_035703 [Liparis tanakae]